MPPKRQPPKIVHLHLSEDTYQVPGRPLMVEDNCVKDVKFVGLVSAHGRVYESAALREAVSKYNDLRSNIDHVEQQAGSPKSTPFGSRFGWAENCRFVEAEGIRGDYRFNPEHVEAKSFCWWAKNKPSMIGFSHNAEGKGSYDANGICRVNSIESVTSIDLVADPATTGGLLESRTPMKTLKQRFTESKSKHKAALLKFLETAGYEDMNVDGSMPPPAGATEETPTDYKADVLAAIAKLLDSADPKDHEKVKKLMKVLMPKSGDLEPELEDEEEEEMQESEDEDEADEKKRIEEKDKKKVPESKTLQAENAKLKADLEAYQLTEAMGNRRTKAKKLAEAKLKGKHPEAVTEVFLDCLVQQTDEKAMQAQIEDRYNLLEGMSKAAKRGKPIASPSGGPDLGTDEAAFAHFVESVNSKDY